MKRSTLSALALLSATSLPLLAQQEAPATKATESEVKSSAEQIQTLIFSFNEDYASHMRKVREEQDREKRNTLNQARPQPNEAVAAILKIAETDPKGKITERALVWCLRTSDINQRKAIGELLLTHYKDSQSINRLAQSWRFDQEQLQAILKRTGNESVRQSITYYLASAKLRSGKQKGEALKMLKELAAWKGIAETNAELLKKVNADIFSIEKLSVGCTAPEIVGTDQDDKEFKLSDYRGQVVLVDFWGHW